MAATAAAAFVACSWRIDPDLWGHLRFGLDAIRDRRLESVDPYSFTSDIPWINHEWLSEVAMGVAFNTGGVFGLWLLKAGILALSFAVLAKGLRSVREPHRWWLLLLAVLACVPIATTLRPQLWTILALSTLLATRNWPFGQKLVFWPVIFVLWANSHGGWIVGIGIIGAMSLGAVLDRQDRYAILQSSALLAACVAATLLTPYGIDLWTFIWSTVGLGRDIQEWRPLWQTDLSVAALWVAVASTVVYLLRRTPFSWAAVLPVFLLGFASAKVVRLIGLFGIVAALLLGTRLAQAPPLRLRGALLLVLWLAAAVPAALASIANVRCLSISADWVPDLQAAGALASPNVQGRLMVPFNWGQFAIWHFAPRLRVSMDGRRETVYSDMRLQQQAALDVGDFSIMPFIAEQRPEYVWLPLPEAEKLAVELANAGYRQDITTQRSTILTRSDLPPLMKAPPILACFP